MSSGDQLSPDYDMTEILESKCECLRKIAEAAIMQIKHDADLLYGDYGYAREKTMAEKMWEIYLVDSKYHDHMMKQRANV